MSSGLTVTDSSASAAKRPPSSPGSCCKTHEVRTSLLSRSHTRYALESWEYPKNIPINILADVLHQDKKILNKFSFRTNFKHVNFICGITKSENYDDFSFGLKVDMKDWSLVFASLSHSNDVLGSPTYVELINKF